MSRLTVIVSSHPTVESSSAALHRFQRGLDLSDPARSVAAHQVMDEETAGRVVLAALAGGVVLALVEAGRLADRLCEDLRRVGSVRVITDGSPRPSGLTAEERMALRLLGDGHDRAAVAARLHLSLRTLDRRLATARSKLGAATLAQAVDAAGSLETEP